MSASPNRRRFLVGAAAAAVTGLTLGSPADRKAMAATPASSSSPAATQGNWRWCNKCQCLAFAGNLSLGPCAAGGTHDHGGSGNYVLTQDDPSAPGQPNWRWCNKCQELAFAGKPSLGPCPAGGSHNHAGSGNYTLVANVPPQPGYQANWRWCNKCQALAFSGSYSLGACAAGGSHNHAGSGNYQLRLTA